MKYKILNSFRASCFGFRAERGQAAMIAVILMLVVMLSAVFGVSAMALKEAKVAEENRKSRVVFFAAEAGMEDAVYRLVRGKSVNSSYLLTLNGATVDITISDVSASQKKIKSSGNFSGAERAAQAMVILGTTNVNLFYGVQVGDGGLEMGNNAVVDGNVYSNGNIIGNNGAEITDGAIVAGGINSNPSVEWTAHDSDHFFATASSNRDIAQSFTASASDRLNKVSVYLGKAGSPSGNITLKIANDNGGKPSTSDIANTTISNASVGTNPSWIDASFSSPPNLTGGNKYWVVLDYGSNSASDHWNWRKDSSDGYAGNTGKYTSNCCFGNPTWTDAGGDLAFRVWIGGVNTKIDNMIIGDAGSGEGHANLFVNTTIRGSSCPNQYCIVENPPREELPVSEGVIQDWRDAAAAGGTCVPPQCDASGDFKVLNGETVFLGPKKITGKLELDNGSTLIVGGTIWVLGEIKLSNNCIVKLAPSYGADSGLILTDNKAVISNGCSFSGSGDPASHFMLLSAKNSPAEEVIIVDNNSQGVIYYASGGRIKFSNNATAKEATGYGIAMDNNAIITYESGLANVNFSSGPAGGWNIINWEEIIP